MDADSTPYEPPISKDRIPQGEWAGQRMRHHIDPTWSHSPVAPTMPDEIENPILRELLETVKRIEARL